MLLKKILSVERRSMLPREARRKTIYPASSISISISHKMQKE